MKKWTKYELLNYASGFYLCEDLPEDWDKLDEEDLYEFLEENAIAGSSYEELGGHLWAEIECMARSLNATFELGITGL